MKLVVAVNHAAPHHVGGSEKVVQQITESMHKDYGMDCHVLARFANGIVTHNGVKVEKCREGDRAFLEQVKALRPDHLHIYSDSFVYWPTIVRHAEEIVCDKSVSLVGMNYMRGHPDIARVFKNKKSQFKVITHSDGYIDYETCKGMGIPVTVIPNAIDLDEFKDQGFSFREKYGIKTKQMVLCVSNFFPGKGQEHLDVILKKLATVNSDFTAVFICTTVNFQPANNLKMQFAKLLSKGHYPSKLLTDIPRSDTIQAFREADVFAFPSQTEVAPLVILEAMACGLPWTALAVGNLPRMAGGFPIYAASERGGKKQYNSDTYTQFAASLGAYLKNEESRKKTGSTGRTYIEQEFNWANIKKDYYKLFTGKEAPCSP